MKTFARRVLRQQLLPALAASCCAVFAQPGVSWAEAAPETGTGTGTSATGKVQAAPADEKAGRKSRKAAARAAMQADTMVSAVPSCVGEMTSPVTLNVAEGKSALLKLPAPVARRTLGDDEIVQARLIGPQTLYVLGLEVGATNMILQDKTGRCTVVDVVVGMDAGALQSKLGQLLPGEKGIKVNSASDSLVLTGTVTDSVVADRAVMLANAYVRKSAGGAGQAGATGPNASSARVVNLLSIAAPQQVMLEVKVAEVSKSILDRFGLNLSRVFAAQDGSLRFMSGIFGGNGGVLGQVTGARGANVGGGILGSVSNGSATSAVTGPLGSATIGAGSTTVPLVGGTGATNLGIDAQKSDGVVKVLAEPNIMAISGQEGSFLAGGKIFIPVAQNNGFGQSISLEEKEFGVSVRFVPTVLEGGRINLAVRPEVSELNKDGVGISAPGVNGLAILPSFTTRKASTTVQLYDGQSFAIGGLIKNNVTTNVKAFPFLGEVPVLGTLFRSSDFQNDRTELIFVITAHLVKPLAEGYKLPTDNYIEPSRNEVILGGRLEGRAPETTPPAPSRPAAPAAPGTAPRADAGFDLN